MMNIRLQGSNQDDANQIADYLNKLLAYVKDPSHISEQDAEEVFNTRNDLTNLYNELGQNDVNERPYLEELIPQGSQPGDMNGYLGKLCQAFEDKDADGIAQFEADVQQDSSDILTHV